MDTQIFYRQRRTTAKYLEEELSPALRLLPLAQHAGRRLRDARHGRAGVPVMTANQIKQMRDEDILVFHHNLPPFKARPHELAGAPHPEGAASHAPPGTDPAAVTDPACTALAVHPQHS